MPGGAEHILVVEDDLDTSELVESILDRAGYDVVSVHCGADALAYLVHVPDRYLVLLDLAMPDMNGWEVLSALQAATGAHHAVVLMSGVAESSMPRGIPVLRKPFTSEELLGIVRTYVRPGA